MTYTEQDLQDAYEAGLMQREGPDELSEEHTAAWYRIEDRQHSNTIEDSSLDNDIRILMHALTLLRDRLAVRSEKVEKLWTLLDNIDTLDDACKEDDATFRNLTRIQQRKRFEIWNPEEGK